MSAQKFFIKAIGNNEKPRVINIDNQDKREFYIAEADKNNWTARQLERQVNTGYNVN